MTQENPFSPFGPVSSDRFVGRKALLRTACDVIYHRSHLAIWGGTKVGKSSFLKKLAEPNVWEEYGLDFSKAIIVRFSCLEITPFFSATGFWKAILSRLEFKLDEYSELKGRLENLMQEQPNREGFRKILKQLGQCNLFLVLLVDDFDESLWENAFYKEADIQHFLSENRSLAYTEESKHFSSIVVSSKQLNKLRPTLTSGSPWYNHFRFEPIEPFTVSEIAELLNDSFIHTMHQDIQSIAGRNPALLQIAAYMLYQRHQQGTTFIRDAEAFKREFMSRTEAIFEKSFKECTPEEQKVLMLVAVSNLRGHLPGGKQFDVKGISNIFDRQRLLLDGLSQRGLIKERGHGEYHFESSIMERWVVSKLTTGENQSLQDRELMLMGLVNQGQAKNLAKAAQWLGENLDKIPIDPLIKLLQ